MKEHDPGNVRYYLITWIIVILVGAFSNMLNGIISGYIAERLGDSLRKRLFASLIYKDTAFYDDSRTGDLRKPQYITFSLALVKRHLASLGRTFDVCSYDCKVRVHLHRHDCGDVHLLVATDHLRNSANLSSYSVQQDIHELHDEVQCQLPSSES